MRQSGGSRRSFFFHEDTPLGSAAPEAPVFPFGIPLEGKIKDARFPERTLPAILALNGGTLPDSRVRKTLGQTHWLHKFDYES